jgi:MFS family permease
LPIRSSSDIRRPPWRGCCSGVLGVCVLLVFFAPSDGLALVGFALTGVGTSVIFPLAMSAAAQLTDRPAPDKRCIVGTGLVRRVPAGTATARFTSPSISAFDGHWRRATDNGAGNLSQTHSFSFPLLPASGQIRSTIPSWFDAQAYEPSRLSSLATSRASMPTGIPGWGPHTPHPLFDFSCMDHAAPSHLST